MLNSITNFSLSFILGLLFIIILKKISLKFNLIRLDKKVSYLGGIGFSFAFIVIYLFYILINKITIPFQLTYIFIFSFIVLGIEFIDDLKDFSLKARIIIQFIIIFGFLLAGKRIQFYFLPHWLNYVISFLWIMGITNAFNHLDIGDGLCGGVSLVVGLGFLGVSVICGDFLLGPLFIILLGGLCAFFIFNLPPAKIFMGNSGSHFLGFLFATLSIYGDYATLENPLALIVPLLILAFPIIDTAYLIFVRLNKKIIPLKKSNDHIFLRLLSRGHSPVKALNIICLVTALWCLGGISIVYGFNYLFLTFIILAFLISCFVVFKAIHIKKM